MYEEEGPGLHLAIIDVVSFFHQIGLRTPSDGRKLSVEHNGVCYSSRTLVMGLASSPGLAAKVLNALFADVVGAINVYVDDVTLVARSFEEYLTIWRIFLERLVDANLTLSPSKTQVGKDKFKLLGVLIDAKGNLHVNEEKSQAVLEMARPTDARGLLSFLSSLNWFKNFVCNLSRLAAPLYALLRTDKHQAHNTQKEGEEGKRDFNEPAIGLSAKARMTQKLGERWGAAEELAFLRLKAALMGAAVLRTYSPHNLDLRVISDASITGHAALIAQAYFRRDGTLFLAPLKYTSQAWKDAEKNYPIYRLEALSILRCFQSERTWFLGHVTAVLSDNLTLAFSLSSTLSDLSKKMTEASLSLMEYSYVLYWISTESNGWADFHSRYPPHGEDRGEGDPEGVYGRWQHLKMEEEPRAQHHQGINEVWERELSNMDRYYRHTNHPALRKLEEGLGPKQGVPPKDGECINPQVMLPIGEEIAARQLTLGPLFGQELFASMKNDISGQ